MAEVISYMASSHAIRVADEEGKSLTPVADSLSLFSVLPG